MAADYPSPSLSDMDAADRSMHEERLAQLPYLNTPRPTCRPRLYDCSISVVCAFAGESGGVDGYETLVCEMTACGKLGLGLLGTMGLLVGMGNGAEMSCRGSSLPYQTSWLFLGFGVTCNYAFLLASSHLCLDTTVSSLPFFPSRSKYKGGSSLAR
jgi:hypothetical protein